jgi:hypothetical protein
MSSCREFLLLRRPHELAAFDQAVALGAFVAIARFPSGDLTAGLQLRGGLAKRLLVDPVPRRWPAGGFSAHQLDPRGRTRWRGEAEG